MIPEPESWHAFQGYVSLMCLVVCAIVIIALHLEEHLHCMDSELRMSANLKELITDIFQQHEEEINQ